MEEESSFKAELELVQVKCMPLGTKEQYYGPSDPYIFFQITVHISFQAVIFQFKVHFCNSLKILIHKVYQM